MYAAQCTGLELGPEYIDDENMETDCVEQLAKEVAVLSQGWPPLDIPLDGFTMAIAQTLSGMRVRTSEGLMTITPTVADVAATILKQKRLRLSVDPYMMV